MRTKKAAALLLAASMCTSLAACGGGTPAPATDAGQTSGAAAGGQSQTAAGGEIATVKISYPCLVVVPSEEGTKNAEAAINAYLEEKGEDVRIDLDPIDGNNYATTVDTALIGGEQMDLFCPIAGLSTAVSGNKVLPLNDYLDSELAETVEIVSDKSILANTYDGNVYAMPCWKGNVLFYYWVIRSDIFEATGISEDEIKTVQDLTPVFEKIKEAYPDLTTLAATPGANNNGNSLQLREILAGVGQYEMTNLLNGLAAFGDEKKIVNYYESDAFAEACRLAYSWNQAGYLADDASITTDLAQDLINAGRAASFLVGYGNVKDSVEAIYNLNSKYKFTAIPVSEALLANNPLNWSVAYNSKNPAAAAKVLNMLYTDETVLNTLIFGVEGEDWVDTGKGEGAIKAIDWPEGKDMASVPYTAALTCGIMGNQFKMYAMEGITKVGDVAFMRENMEKATYSPIFGFSVNVDKVKTQVSAVGNVISQYEGGMYCGEMNPEEYIPRMVADLKAAGIDDIIQEAQSQLDAWEQ